VLHPSISQIYSLYYNSFRVISSTKPPQTLDDNERFVEVLERLVQTHLNTIPTLAKGFFEASRYISAEEASKILDNHLRARIGTRLLAEHHIALTHPIGDNFIGSIQKDLRPADIIKSCASFVGEICEMKYGVVPHVSIDAGENVQLAYVPIHVEYIFTELLKNAFRAVIEHGNPDIPVSVIISRTATGVAIRVRDRGGGVPPEILDQIFGFAYSTFEDGEGDGFATLNSPPGGGGSTIAGLGYGLPLSRAYAEFFGGSLQLQSYHGHGTDIYLNLRSPLTYEPPPRASRDPVAEGIDY
jgi:signal transduction histidine kinase